MEDLAANDTVREAMRTLRRECPGDIYEGTISEPGAEPDLSRQRREEGVICDMGGSKVEVSTTGRVHHVTISEDTRFQTTTSFDRHGSGDGGRWGIRTEDFVSDDRDSFFQIWEDVPR